MYPGQRHVLMLNICGRKILNAPGRVPEGRIRFLVAHLSS